VIVYRAILDVPRELALYVSGLLRAERRRRGTRKQARSLTCFWQAVLGLRWFRDHRDVTALARDHRISRATSYRYLAEVIDVLAAQVPDLHETLRQAHDAGAAYVILDGKLFTSDRLGEKATSVKGKPIDAWYSGKAHQPAGNIQGLLQADGFPLWVSDVEPGPGVWSIVTMLLSLSRSGRSCRRRRRSRRP
jgi:hypothetical protein